MLKKYLVYNRFKWKTAGCISEAHEYMCAMYIPRCPKDYTFRPEMTSKPGVVGNSCYKITDADTSTDSLQ